MREFFLRLLQAILLVLMTAYLPVYWLASRIAKLMRSSMDALEVALVLASAHRKVQAAIKRRNAR